MAGSERSLKERWRAGEVTLGAWCVMPGAMGAEVLARQGFDWIMIDMQHGCIEYGDALTMIRAVDQTPAPPIVRVPCNEPSMIGRVLDAGARGVLVPMIQTAEDAQKVVDAALYPPLGRRSFGPVRVGLRDGPTYFTGANERIAVIVMIETKEALEAIDEIASVPGVSALFVGPFDLSLALGLPPGDNDGEPVFDEAIQRVTAATKRAGIATAVLSNPRVARLRMRQGFQMISVTTDYMALGAASRADLESVRKEVPSSR